MEDLKKLQSSLTELTDSTANQIRELQQQLDSKHTLLQVLHTHTHTNILRDFICALVDKTAPYIMIMVLFELRMCPVGYWFPIRLSAGMREQAVVIKSRDCVIWSRYEL